MSGRLYILASRPGGAIYTGVTADLSLRVWQHKQKRGGAHTRRYDIRAIQPERYMKRWPRAWKCNLIYAFNPTWRDLYEELNRAPDPSPIGVAGPSQAMTRGELAETNLGAAASAPP